MFCHDVLVAVPVVVAKAPYCQRSPLMIDSTSQNRVDKRSSSTFSTFLCLSHMPPIGHAAGD